MEKNINKYRVSLLINKDMYQRILSPLDLEFLHSFAEIQTIEMLPEKVDEAFLVEAIRDADACITCWGTTKLTDTVLDQAPKLKLIAHAAGSVKQLFSDSVWDRNIKITSASPIIAIDVAETALGFMIIALKRIMPFAAQTRAGLWNKKLEEDNMTRLHHINIGIVGASHVGRNLIGMLKPFDVNILLYDPFVTEEEAGKLGATKVTLEELMSQSKVVSLHAPKVPATYQMINKNNLVLLQDGAVLINTSRGALIDEAALIEELKKGRIFACIDVTDPDKPSEDNLLRKLDNVILTPHIAGGHTVNGRYEQGHYIVQEVYNYLIKGQLKYEVTKKMLDTIA